MRCTDWLASLALAVGVGTVQADERHDAAWEAWSEQAARTLVARLPGATYMGEVPAVLLAIPVLDVDLNADGSVAAIRVVRVPGQAEDTVQLAIDAVRRAAPYGSVRHLPKPWTWREFFLFDDARRFKPRILDK